jgi:hypothetical protein
MNKITNNLLIGDAVKLDGYNGELKELMKIMY